VIIRISIDVEPHPGTGVVEWERFLKGQPQGIAPTRTQNKNDIVGAILYGCPEV